MKRYRIVTDGYAGYEVQVKVWFWPFWFQCNLEWDVNTFSSIEEAERWVNKRCRKITKIVKYL